MLHLQGSHTKRLQFLVDCLHTNFPLLVMADDCHAFVRNLQTLAHLSGRKLNRLLLNDRSDTTQLLGCFEQTSQDLTVLQKDLVDAHRDLLPAQVIKLEHQLAESAEDAAVQLGLIEEFIARNEEKLARGGESWARRLRQYKRAAGAGKSRFEWVDSVLITSIVRGEWVVFENANLCNPSILDRLNSLLEEGNQTLSINEQGLVEGDRLREVKAHPDFRPIFLISKQSFVD